MSGDVVTVTATGAFTDPAVGNGKLVNLFSRYGGADAGNYTITGQTSTLANITAAATATAASPAASSPSVNPPQQVRDTVTQVQSSVLSPQSASRPQSLALSPTLAVSAEARDDARNDEASRTANVDLGRTNLGAIGPVLQIRNGGTQLPDDVSRTAE